MSNLQNAERNEIWKSERMLVSLNRKKSQKSAFRAPEEHCPQLLLVVLSSHPDRWYTHQQ